jgi:hypothetical protein
MSCTAGKGTTRTSAGSRPLALTSWCARASSSCPKGIRIAVKSSANGFLCLVHAMFDKRINM